MTNSAAPDSMIAIVGLAGRFPACRSADELWKLLREGREATRWLSPEEAIAAGENPGLAKHPNYVAAALTLPDMEMFDEGFFSFTPREAAILDPQHRQFLECCWESLEDAGHVPERFNGAIGVFAGCGMQSYFANNILTNPDLVDQFGMFLLRHTGNDKDFLTTRASYLLDLRGPSVGVQTACSTSLVAVHLASQSLLAGECDMALAGGVSIEATHGRGYRYADGEILARDGHCRAFDDDATGTLFGSGAGIVVLRRLKDAIAEGDNIYCVLRGSAVSNDGALKAGYFAPSIEGQVRAAAEALAVSGVAADTISYVEAHGTGTLVGDPIELTALHRAYYGDGPNSLTPGSVPIGSLKTNIGHLDTAAGVASLIKVALAMRHELIPASLNFTRPNSRFDFANSPFAPAATPRPWPRTAIARRASVNSLGVGGTNAHLIVEEAPAAASAGDTPAAQLFLFSAKSARALEGLAAKWRNFLADGAGDISFADAAFTTHVGRKSFAHRFALSARDFAELGRKLSPRPQALPSTNLSGRPAPRVVFMFPGGGAQFPGAGCTLYEQAPVFRAAADECFALLAPQVSAELRDLMFSMAPDEDAAAQLARPLQSILAVFVHAYAMARLWISWGVRPAAVIGHSAGDYAAAVIAGVMSLPDALATIMLRGRIFEHLGPGGMLIAKTSVAEAAGAGDGVDLAAVNGAQLVVLSGPHAALENASAHLRTRGVETSRVRIDVAAHSRMLEPHLPSFKKHMAKLELNDPQVPFASNLAGALASAGELRDPDYWVRHLRNTVRFSDGLEAVLCEGETILLEVGPGETLSTLAELKIEHPARDIIASAPRREERTDDFELALAAAGRLWSNGVDLDFARIRGPGARRRVSLPTYAFEKNRHWIEPGKATIQRWKPGPARSATFDDWFCVREFELAPIGPASAPSERVWLLFLEHSPVSAALAEAVEARPGRTIIVEPGDTFSETADGRFRLNPSSREEFDALARALEARGVRPNAIIYAWALASAGPREADLAASRQLWFDAPLYLAQAIQVWGWADDIHLCALTARAFALESETPRHPERAGVLGPCRVLPRENPGARAQVLDIDIEEDTAVTARGILAEIDTAAREALVLHRAGMRYVEQWRPASRSSREPLVRERGVYVITGGLGAIGLALAKHLARKVRARVILLALNVPASRAAWRRLERGLGRPEEVERARAVREIERAGADVVVLKADVADRQSLARALQEARRRFGSIDGVFHAAGRIDDSPIASKGIDEATAVLKPKVNGTLLLDELLPEGKLDFLAAFSSTSVLLGPPGQADYVAANAVLESLIAKRKDGVCISWGAWADFGMALRRLDPSCEAELDPADHPLLGARQTTLPGVITYWPSLDPNWNWELGEHRIAGRAVLPGAALVEMAIAACQSAGLGHAIQLRGASFVEPLVGALSLPHRLRITLTSLAEGEHRIEIESRIRPSDPFRLHFQAFVEDAEPEAPLPQLPPDVELSPIPQNALAMDDRGIAFGPRWRCLRFGARGNNWVRADLRPDQNYLGERDTYFIHPALFDVASSIGLYLLGPAAGRGKVFAPTAIERLSFVAPLPPEITARAHLVRHSAPDEASFDVDICDRTGGLCLAIRGLTFRRIDPANAHSDPAASEEATPLSHLLAAGFRAEDAPALFDRVLTSSARSIIATSAPLPDLDAYFSNLQPGRADKQGRSGRARAPVQDLETSICVMCAEALGVDAIGPDDEFLSYGGGSLAGVRLFARIRRELGVDLALSALFSAPTPRHVAELVASARGELSGEPANAAPPRRPASSWTPLVRMQSGRDDQEPLFCIHGAGGNIVTYKALIDRLAPDTPIFGLQAQGIDGKLPFHDTIEDMAIAYLEAIQAIDPKGPYRLIGYSGGGVIAFEMAQRLKAQAKPVTLLAMLDTLAPQHMETPITRLDKLRLLPRADPQFLLHWPERTWRKRQAEQRVMHVKGDEIPDDVSPIEVLGNRAWHAFWNAQLKYRAQPYDGDVVLFRAKRASFRYISAGATLGWDELVNGRVEVIAIDAWHDTVFDAPSVDIVAAELAKRL